MSGQSTRFHVRPFVFCNYGAGTDFGFDSATASFATFDRLKAKGVEAYKNGDYLAAKAYLVDAAGCMIEVAETVETPEARR